MLRRTFLALTAAAALAAPQVATAADMVEYTPGLVDQALAARSPPTQTRHIRLRPGLVDEDQAPGIELGLIGFPVRSLLGDVRQILLGGVDRLSL